MWNLYRASTADDPNGSLIRKYQDRRDASKVVAQVAYQPDQLLLAAKLGCAVFLFSDHTSGYYPP